MSQSVILPPSLLLVCAQSLEGVADLAIAADSSGIIIYASHGAERWLGPALAPGSVLGEASLSEDETGTGAAAWYAVTRLREALAAEQAVAPLRARCRCYDGQERVLRWRTVPVHDPAGQLAGAVALAEIWVPDAVQPVPPRWDETEPSYHLLRAVVSSMAEGVIVVDAQGRLILGNTAAQRITGRAVPQGYALLDEWARGHSYLEGAEGPSAADSSIRRALRGETVHRVAQVVAHPDGRTVHIEGTASPVRGPDGAIQGAMYVFRDVTNRKRAEAERSRLVQALATSTAHLQAVLDGLEVGIALIGRDGRAVLFNRVLREMLGIDQDPVGLPGDELQRLTRERLADPEAFERVVQDATEAGREVGRSELTLTFPKRRVVQRVSVPALDDGGEPLGRLVMYHDITELRDLDRLKDDFISAAAHELRTPLTSVAGYSQLLHRRLMQLAPLSEQFEDYFGVSLSQTVDFAATLVSEAGRLSRLVSLLLDISRIQAGRFEVTLRPLDAARVVPAVIERLRLTVTSHPIVYKGPARRGAVVLANEDRLEQVITNLVENAAHYSPAGSPITVRLERRTAGTRNVLLSVADSGFGIATEEMEQVFERAYRGVEAAARAPGGMGIGLYLCRAILQQMGGTIWCESEGRGRGSTFMVSLPLVSNSGEGGRSSEP